MNRVQTGTSPLDGRPTYSKVSKELNDAPMLSTTRKGHESIYSLQFNRPFSHGVTLSAAYAHQNTNTAFDATSSRAISNWQFRPTKGDIFQQDTYHSAFEVRHRFNIAATYDLTTGPFTHSFGAFWNAQAGHPYSLLVGGDPNMDGAFTNDLLYVPASPDAVIIKNASGAVVPYDTFGNYLSAAGVNPTAGRILDANSLREPWARQLDLHYELGLPGFRTARAAVTFDVLNFLNMIDKDYGVVKSVTFQTYTPVAYRGIDKTTKKPIYQESFNGALTPGRQYSVADLRSRWQGRLGLRVNF
jgi:hypothetical protein